jgi:arsenite methyltransferase
MTEDLVARVRERYSLIASGAEPGCCGLVPGAAGPEARLARKLGYEEAALAGLPGESNLGLGCGAPLTFLAPKPGETVLDLGSGPGLDALLAAQQVGRRPSAERTGLTERP